MCTFFYHSGLEAYCKSAAEMLGDERLALSLCQDLLPDRTQGTLVRTWCLSNQRQGRGNRMSIFERCWPCDGEHGGSHLHAHLIEAGAVHKCVNAIVESMISDRDARVADGVASVQGIFEMDSYKEQLNNQIIPAILHGFICERYRGSEIERFKGVLIESVNALPDEAPDYGGAKMAQLLKVLVSGLIYGPAHFLVRARCQHDPTWNAAVDRTEAVHAEPEPRPDTAIAIRLTQVLDKDCRYTGFSEVFAQSVAVFLGREAGLDKYEERCEEVFSDRPEVLAALNDCEKIVFPVNPTCFYVSGVHALLLFMERSYYLYDLGSTNGTTIQGLEGGDAQAVKNVLVALPGDKLTFGAPDVNDAAAYNNAVTLLLTRDLGRSMQLG